MSKREGPRVSLDASCLDCAHERSERYAVQGDSGHDVTCAHPDAPAPARVGDTRWNTPKWCPLMTVAVDGLIESIRATRGSVPRG